MKTFFLIVHLSWSSCGSWWLQPGVSQSPHAVASVVGWNWCSSHCRFCWNFQWGPYAERNIIPGGCYLVIQAVPPWLQDWHSNLSKTSPDCRSYLSHSWFGHRIHLMRSHCPRKWMHSWKIVKDKQSMNIKMGFVP